MSGKLLDLLAAREDAELQQKVSLELRDIPNTIPAFKCGSLSNLSSLLSLHARPVMKRESCTLEPL